MAVRDAGKDLIGERGDWNANGGFHGAAQCRCHRVGAKRQVIRVVLRHREVEIDGCAAAEGGEIVHGAGKVQRWRARNAWTGATDDQKGQREGCCCAGRLSEGCSEYATAEVQLHALSVASVAVAESIMDGRGARYGAVEHLLAALQHPFIS